MKNTYATAALACVLGAGAACALDTETVKTKSMASSDELSSVLTIIFRDAITGAPIEEADISFEGKEAKTTRKGTASFPFPRIPAHIDKTLTATFSKKGYVPTRAPLLFSVGTVFNNTFSISPALPPGKLRIVLDWGGRPDDLDAHLIKKGVYHISFRDTQHYQDQARLDRDDMDGGGPETITVDKPAGDAEYLYYIHDFSNRTPKAHGQIGSSRARITVFQSDALVKTFTAHGIEGKYWTVFAIRNGEIIPIDKVGDAPLDKIPAQTAAPAAPAEGFSPTIPDDLE